MRGDELAEGEEAASTRRRASWTHRRIVGAFGGGNGCGAHHSCPSSSPPNGDRNFVARIVHQKSVIGLRRLRSSIGCGRSFPRIQQFLSVLVRDDQEQLAWTLLNNSHIRRTAGSSTSRLDVILRVGLWFSSDHDANSAASSNFQHVNHAQFTMQLLKLLLSNQQQTSITSLVIEAKSDTVV
jgi:hypothetical protein